MDVLGFHVHSWGTIRLTQCWDYQMCRSILCRKKRTRPVRGTDHLRERDKRDRSWG